MERFHLFRQLHGGRMQALTERKQNFSSLTGLAKHIERLSLLPDAAEHPDTIDKVKKLGLLPVPKLSSTDTSPIHEHAIGKIRDCRQVLLINKSHAQWNILPDPDLN